MGRIESCQDIPSEGSRSRPRNAFAGDENAKQSEPMSKICHTKMPRIWLVFLKYTLKGWLWMKPWLYRWAPAVFIMAIIFFASATPGSDLPKFGNWDFLAKKGGHVFGYALLAPAYLHALGGNPRSRSRLLLSLVLAILYACSDEWHQRFTPGRTPSVTDVFIDTAGATIGLTISCLVRRRPMLNNTANT